MKNILIINGHPSPESLTGALADAYESGAEASGYTVKRTNVADLEFDPILRSGYLKEHKLEPDLV